MLFIILPNENTNIVVLVYAVNVRKPLLDRAL